MKNPTDVLRDEHTTILGALDVIEHAADRAEAGASLPATWWADMIAWLRGFADQNHHAKEERSLFPALVKAGVPSEGGPVGVMLAEHDPGRALIRRMESEDTSVRVEAARRYAALLRAHIAKENDVLFMIADSVLEEPVQRGLAREFEAVADELGATASREVAETRLAALASAAVQ